MEEATLIEEISTQDRNEFEDPGKGNEPEVSNLSSSLTF